MSNPNEKRKHLNHTKGWGFQSDFWTKPFRFTSETDSIFWTLTGKIPEPIIFTRETTFLLFQQYQTSTDFTSYVVCPLLYAIRGSNFPNKQVTPGCTSDTLMSDTPIKEAHSHYMVLVRYHLTQKCSSKGKKIPFKDCCRLEFSFEIRKEAQ